MLKRESENRFPGRQMCQCMLSNQPAFLGFFLSRVLVVEDLSHSSFSYFAASDIETTSQLFLVLDRREIRLSSALCSSLSYESRGNV